MNDKHPRNPNAAGPNPSGDFVSKLNDLGHKLRYLRRSRNDRVFGGVAGGIAEVLGVETVVVRVVFVVLSVMTGVGFFAYLIAWALIAKAPEGQHFDLRSAHSKPNHGAATSSGFTLGPNPVPKRMESRQLMAVAIVSIGVLSLFNRMGINLNGDVLWPLALIGIGSAVLFSKSSNQYGQSGPNTDEYSGDGDGEGGFRHRDGFGGGDGGGGGWPGSDSSGSGGSGLGLAPESGERSLAAGVGSSSVAWPTSSGGTSDSSGVSARLNAYPTQGPTTQGQTTQGPSTQDATTQADGSNGPSSRPTPDDLLNQARREVDALSMHESWLATPIGSTQSSATSPGQLLAQGPRASKKFSRMILGTTLVLGGFFAIALRSGWMSVGGIDNLLAMALIGVGAVVFLGAWFRRPFGFLALGLLLFAMLASASFVGAKWGDGVGERAYQPKSLSELRNRYRLGAGSLKLDLTKIDFTKRARVVDVELGVGEVAVEVPADTSVAVATTTRGGEVTLFGKTNERTSRKFTIGDATKPPQLTLNVRAGVGAIEVARAGKLTKLTGLDSVSISHNFGSDSTDDADATEIEVAEDANV